MHRKVIYTALAWVPLVAPPAPGNADFAFASTSAQIINRTIVFEDAPSYALPPPELITVDKWYAPLATPVRLKRVTAEEGSIFGSPPRPEASDQVAWHDNLDLPVRRKVSLTDHRATFPIQPQAKDSQAWHSPLTTPTRLARSTYAGQTFVYSYDPVVSPAQPGDAESGYATSTWQVLNKTIVYEPDAYAPYTPDAVVETVTIDKWWRELAVPVRRKFVTGEEGSHFGSPPRAEANDAVAWHDNLEFPTRLKRLPLGAYPFEARAQFPQVPWGWYEKLEDPTRAKKTPATQLSLTFTAAAPGAGTEYNWFLPIEIPTRARKLYEYPATAIPVYFVPPTPGAGFEYNWWEPLGEPIRPRKALKTGAQQGLAAPSLLVTTTLEYAWHQRLSEPVRLKRAPPQLDSAYGWFTPSEAETVTIDKWWRELARPTLQRARINYPALSSANINPIVPFARTWVDDPRRIRPRFNTSIWAQGNINPIVPFARTWVDDPRRRLKRVDRPALAQQGALYPPLVEVLTLDKYWRQLDLPVREWRRIAWQHSITVPPQGVSFFEPGGPADEPERVICILETSRVASAPLFLREATVALQPRVATVPEESRLVYVPTPDRDADSNLYRDEPCVTIVRDPTPVTPEEPSAETTVFQDDAFDNDAFD